MLRAAALAAGLCLAACATEQQSASRSSAYADYLIGRMANLRQDHVAAADRYFAALARTPHDEAMIEGALVAALASGDVDRARRGARNAPRDAVGAYVHLVRAADALAGDRARDAERELSLVEGAAPREFIGRMMMIWTNAADGRVDAAVRDLAPLATIRPYGALFGYQQAMALDYAGRGDEALAVYESAGGGGLWLPAGIERHADLLARRGAREQAIALLSNDQNRNNPALAAALGRIEAGEPAALSELSPARGAAIGLYGLAAIFEQEGDATTALTALTLSSMLDPSFDAARVSFAQTQIDLGHPELAQEALARVAPDSPYASGVRAMQAWMRLRGGDEETALAMMRAEAAAGDARAERTLGEMYRSLERYDQAEPLYSDLIARDGSDWRFYFWRGASRERLGRWPEAEADFQHALTLSPDQPEVLNYLGYGWIDRGERLQEGLALIERALQLRPNSGAIIDSLGWAHYRMGDYAQALEHLERAVEFEPGEATLNDHLGDVYWRVGRRTEARFQWRRALTLEPEDAAPIEAKLEHGLPDPPATHSAAR